MASFLAEKVPYAYMWAIHDIHPSGELLLRARPGSLLLRHGARQEILGGHLSSIKAKGTAAKA